MAKKFQRRIDPPWKVRQETFARYDDKFFNLWLGCYEWEGLEREERIFVMKELWATGSVCAFRPKGAPSRELERLVGLPPARVCFSAWAGVGLTPYGFHSMARPIKIMAAPWIPDRELLIGEECVIGWGWNLRKPVRSAIAPIVERIVEVEMAIRTNVFNSKIPVLLSGDPESVSAASEAIERAYDDELAVPTAPDIGSTLQMLPNGATPIYKDLYAYKKELEGEALEILGLNSAAQEKKERLLVDEVNANNESINAAKETILRNLEEFCKGIREVLGAEISVRYAYERPLEGQSPEGKEESQDGDVESSSAESVEI